MPSGVLAAPNPVSSSTSATRYRPSFGSPRVRVTSLLVLSLFLLIVGNLGRVPILDGGKKEAPLLLTDLLVVAVVTAGGVAASRNRTLLVDRTAQLAILFAMVGAISAVLAIPRFDLTGFQFFFSVAYLVRWFVYFCLYLVVLNLVQQRDVERIWGALEAAILVFAGFGVIQSIFLPGFAQIVQPSAAWDQQGHRLVSSFLDPNFAGGFIMVGLLVLLARLASGAVVSRWKLVLLAAALLMTISRSSILGTLVGASIIFAMKGLSKRLIGLVILFLLLLTPFLPTLIQFANDFGRFSLEGSGAQRFIVWLQALEMIRDHPIIGIGFNTYGYVQEFYDHSSALGGFHYFSLDGGLLFIMVMTGAVGVVLYAAMLWTVVLRGLRISRDGARPASERGLGLGIAAVTVAMVVHSVFLNSLLFTLLMQPLWVLWGLTGVMELAAGKADADAGQPSGAGVPVLVALTPG